MVTILDLPEEIIHLICNYRLWALLSFTCRKFNSLTDYYKYNKYVYKFGTGEVVSYKTFIDKLITFIKPSEAGYFAMSGIAPKKRQQIYVEMIDGGVIITIRDNDIIICSMNNYAPQPKADRCISIMGSVFNLQTFREPAIAYIHDNYPELFQHMCKYKKLTIADSQYF